MATVKTTFAHPPGVDETYDVVSKIPTLQGITKQSLSTTDVFKQSCTLADLLNKNGKSDCNDMVLERKNINSNEMKLGKTPEQKRRSFEAWHSVYMRVVFRDLMALQYPEEFCSSSRWKSRPDEWLRAVYFLANLINGKLLKYEIPVINTVVKTRSTKPTDTGDVRVKVKVVEPSTVCQPADVRVSTAGQPDSRAVGPLPAYSHQFCVPRDEHERLQNENAALRAELQALRAELQDQTQSDTHKLIIRQQHPEKLKHNVKTAKTSVDDGDNIDDERTARLLKLRNIQLERMIALQVEALEAQNQYISESESVLNSVPRDSALFESSVRALNLLKRSSNLQHESDAASSLVLSPNVIRHGNRTISTTTDDANTASLHDLDQSLPMAGQVLQGLTVALMRLTEELKCLTSENVSTRSAVISKMITTTHPMVTSSLEMIRSITHTLSRHVATVPPVGAHDSPEARASRHSENDLEHSSADISMKRLDYIISALPAHLNEIKREIIAWGYDMTGQCCHYTQQYEMAMIELQSYCTRCCTIRNMFEKWRAEVMDVHDSGVNELIETWSQYNDILHSSYRNMSRCCSGDDYSHAITNGVRDASTATSISRGIISMLDVCTDVVPRTVSDLDALRTRINVDRNSLISTLNDFGDVLDGLCNV